MKAPTRQPLSTFAPPPAGSLVAIVAVLLAAMITAGCRGQPRDADHRREQRTAREWEVRRPPPPREQTSELTLPTNAEPTLVRQGALPLVYLVEAEAAISIVDLSDGTRLATTSAAPGTIVRVDARRGVVVGGERLVPGPLSTTNRYGIYILPGESSVKTETVAPAPPREER